MAEYQGIVVNAKGDPKKQLQVQVHIPGKTDQVPRDKLPWATYKLPVGAGAGRGDFTPVQDGDVVWIDFPYKTVMGAEDTRKPRIVGGVHASPDGTLNLPDEAYGKPFQHDRSGEGAPPASSGGYCGSKVVSFHGSTVEFVPDGTLRLFSRGSGAIIEILPGGRIYLKGEFQLDGNMKVNGEIVASGDIIAGGAGGVSLMNHLTDKVVPGSGVSGKPVQ